MTGSDLPSRPSGILRPESYDTESHQDTAAPSSILGIGATQSPKATPKCTFKRDTPTLVSRIPGIVSKPLRVKVPGL